MEMDFTEHSQKRGEALNFLEIIFSETLNYAIKMWIYIFHSRFAIRHDVEKKFFSGRKNVIDRHFRLLHLPFALALLMLPSFAGLHRTQIYA